MPPIVRFPFLCIKEIIYLQVFTAECMYKKKTCAKTSNFHLADQQEMETSCCHYNCCDNCMVRCCAVIMYVLHILLSTL